MQSESVSVLNNSMETNTNFNKTHSTKNKKKDGTKKKKKKKNSYKNMMKNIMSGKNRTLKQEQQRHIKNISNALGGGVPKKIDKI